MADTSSLSLFTLISSADETDYFPNTWLDVRLTKRGGLGRSSGLNDAFSFHNAHLELRTLVKKLKYRM